ncbi:MAG: electron transfer flavoprotein subunit beta/FixA family protein [Anaerolineales bacterium]|nr:electron transfer flavoprotein subunit beta/FixA family protein [Anaerolineales bacterium]
MKILVCIKQVPDMESRFKVNRDGTWIEEQDLAFRMNEYDEFAVEQAVQTKEQLGTDVDVTVLSLGPGRVTEALKKALAMGCDRAVHIQDEASAQKEPWQIAGLIAAYARGQAYDLVFTGLQSQDRGSAQVGVLLAELLGMVCVTTVIDFALKGTSVSVSRELEGGLKAAVQFDLPAVVTCQLGLNTPRYPTLPNIMKARQKELLVVPAADLLLEQALTATEKMYPPARKEGGLVLEGEIDDLADRLLAVLKEKTTVLRQG